MNLFNWIEIAVTNMDRAQKFYEQAFDVEITVSKMGDSIMGFFPFEEGIPRAAGALVLHEDYIPSHQGTVPYFSVKEINDTLLKINGGGGRTLAEKFSIGEHGFCGYFEDSEGNKIALHQNI